MQTLRTVYAQPGAYAARQKAAGRRIVGYFCDSIPVELIQATGALPLRITGYPAPPQAVLDEKLFALLPKGFWQVRQTGLEFLNHSFGRIVGGEYAMLDALLIPNTRKPLLNMVGQLRNAKAAFPDMPLPQLIVLDRAATPVPSAHAFNRDSVLLLREELARFAGQPITDDALRAALNARRATAQHLRTILNWRQAATPGISGTDLLAIIGAAQFMDATEYAGIISELAASGPKPVAHAGKRVFIGGSPPDNDRLYRIVESTGSTIVGEDHCWGERYADFGTDLTNEDPMTQLVRRWDCSAACAFRLPFAATTSNIIRRAKAARAEAVILNVFRGDEMQIWDTPGTADALRAEGFPVLHLSEQPHIISDEVTLATRVRNFLQSADSKVAS